MTPSTGTTTQNGLLSAMSNETLSSLHPHMLPVQLLAGQVLVEAGRPTAHVYFIASGLASNVASSSDAESIEVGHVGREGLSGTHVLLGTDNTPIRTVMQGDGFGFGISANALLDITHSDGALRELLMRYVHSCSMQLAHSALAHGRYNIRGRVARWLLMHHDRSDGNDLPLTHELLALMLGVRRSGVTIEVQNIEGLGIIRATRGHVEILDRPGLERLAGGSYGVPESEYSRLIGDRHPSDHAPTRVEPVAE